MIRGDFSTHIKIRDIPNFFRDTLDSVPLPLRDPNPGQSTSGYDISFISTNSEHDTTIEEMIKCKEQDKVSCWKGSSSVRKLGYNIFAFVSTSLEESKCVDLGPNGLKTSRGQSGTRVRSSVGTGPTLSCP